MAVAALPIAVMLTASAATPLRCSMEVSSICDEEPAVVTPAMCPFRSATDVSVAALCGEVTSTSPGNRNIVTKATISRPSAAI